MVPRTAGDRRCNTQVGGLAYQSRSAWTELKIPHASRETAGMLDPLPEVPLEGTHLRPGECQQKDAEGHKVQKVENLQNRNPQQSPECQDPLRERKSPHADRVQYHSNKGEPLSQGEMGLLLDDGETQAM